MKNFFLIFILSVGLFFTACNDSSKEAKELLQRILNLIGIPQSIVVNICQDGNSNGLCDIGELQKKLTINRGDEVEKIFEKLLFEEDGSYILKEFDLTKKILMKLVDNNTLYNSNQEVILNFNPQKDVTEQELSILQSLVDNNFLEEEEIAKLRVSTKRELVDRVLLENLFQNQAILVKNSIGNLEATELNLAYIAEGLRDIGVSGNFVEQLESCQDNSRCEDDFLLDTNQQTEISINEAKLIAEQRSIKGTGDRDTLLTKEEDTAEDDTTKNSISTEKNIVDGYIIKLAHPATATCFDNDFSTEIGKYSSDLSIKSNGLLTFKGVALDDHCSISIPTGATIDSNNNGMFDSSDKVMNFEMKSFGDYKYISPLTTLAYIKKHNGKDIKAFGDMVKNFDPISAYEMAEGDDQIEKLLTLMDMLKAILAHSDSLETEIANLDITSVIDSSVSFENFNINLVTANLSNSQLKNEAEARAKIMKRTLQLMASIDRNRVDISTFIVNISDGGLNIVDALQQSIRGDLSTSDRDNISTIVKKVIKEGYTPSQISGINDYFIDLSYNITQRDNKNFSMVESENSFDANIVKIGYIMESDYFISTWKTDNFGESDDNQVEISTNSNYRYNYFIDWGDSTYDADVKGDITHTYPTIGTYKIKIYKDFPTLYNEPLSSGISLTYTDSQKLISVDQWGTISWKSMESTLFNCNNVVINASDKPNLSQVTDMSKMFYGTANFNQNIGDWDVSNITNMNQMFYLATSFNQNIGSWDVSNVTDMGEMFSYAQNFNQDINSWSVSNVTDMSSMFYYAQDFNQTIEDWKVSNVKDMFNMFAGITLTKTNYSNMLYNWSDLSLENNVTFSGGSSKYTIDGNISRQYIIDNFNWTITDGGF